MTRKDIKNIKQIHSKRTGAIILIAKLLVEEYLEQQNSASNEQKESSN